jgi:hypothetical protein
MSRNVISRRTVLGGAAAYAGATALPTEAHAFLAALLAGIRTLVVLWSGYKMVEEVYERFFAEKKALITDEVTRVYGPQYFIIQNYYQFGNPYRVPHLGSAEPGCEVAHRFQPNGTSLCCGALERPVLLPTGCIIALEAAVNELRNSQKEDNIFAYTRPIRYVRPVEPWQAIDPSGIQLKSDLQYYSTSGSVALRWLITDRNRRTCRGEYKIRDDHSNRIVAEGQTSPFTY